MPDAKLPAIVGIKSVFVIRNRVEIEAHKHRLALLPMPSGIAEQYPSLVDRPIYGAVAPMRFAPCAAWYAYVTMLITFAINPMRRRLAQPFSVARLKTFDVGHNLGFPARLPLGKPGLYLRMQPNLLVNKLFDCVT